jgi:hypothetical protein
MKQTEREVRKDKPNKKQINNVKVRYAEAEDFNRSLVLFFKLGDLVSIEARDVLTELFRRRSLAAKLLANDTWVTSGSYNRGIPMEAYDEAIRAIVEMTAKDLQSEELQEFDDLVEFPEQFGLFGIESGSPDQVELMFENAHMIDSAYDTALARGIRYKALEPVALRIERNKLRPKSFGEIMEKDLYDIELLVPSMISDRTLVPLDAMAYFFELYDCKS